MVLIAFLVADTGFVALVQMLLFWLFGRFYSVVILLQFVS